MLRFLAITLLTLIGNGLGLLVASWLLPGFSISYVGFIWSIIFFTIAQLILTPFVLSMSIRYLPALRGGIALVATFVVLVLTTWFTGGVVVDGLVTWILAPLIIWITTIIAGILLPLVLFKKVLAKTKESKSIEKEL